MAISLQVQSRNANVSTYTILSFAITPHARGMGVYDNHDASTDANIENNGSTRSDGNANTTHE